MQESDKVTQVGDEPDLKLKPFSSFMGDSAEGNPQFNQVVSIQSFTLT